MAASVTHSFVSGIADDPAAAAAGEVLPSHWNAGHVISGIRTQQSADVTYYVRTDGSDSNDGLTNNAGGAFLTIQHAMDVIALYDWNGFNPQVVLGDGTYVEDLVCPPVLNVGFSQDGTRPGNVPIISGSNTPANVTIKSTTTGFYGIYGAGFLTRWAFYSVTLHSQSTKAWAVANSGAELTFGNLILEASGGGPGVGFQANSFALISFPYNIAITGFANNLTINTPVGFDFIESLSQSVVDMQVGTLTLGAGVSWGNVCVNSSRDGIVFFYYDTLVGSATGKRFSVATGSGIETFGGGANFIPGDVAGTADAATYGWYE